MALLVLKFGGSSLADTSRIDHVANIIQKTKAKGHQIVVVVSAMMGDTDRLVSLSEAMLTPGSKREYAVLVSSGEQVSMSLLSMALNKMGLKSLSLTGAQAGILTSDDYTKARILDIDTKAIKGYLNDDNIVVVAGFQGANQKGEITTLGRGGSDTTAVAIAAAIKASECQIFTDVDGIYTTDPRLVESARRLKQITFEEMLELSSLGAKVLQIRAIEFAGKYHVPLRVLSTFKEGPGTLISYKDNHMEKPIVSGIAFNKSEAKITILGVPDRPGVAHEIISAVSEKDIEIDMIIQNIGHDKSADFTFTIARDDYDKVMEMLKPIVKTLGAQSVEGDTKIAKLSIVGVGMRSHSGVACQMFKTLSEHGINIQMISTSEIKVSVIIDEKYIELGVRALHDAFKLDRIDVEEFDPKMANVGNI